MNACIQLPSGNRIPTSTAPSKQPLGAASDLSADGIDRIFRIAISTHALRSEAASRLADPVTCAERPPSGFPRFLRCLIASRDQGEPESALGSLGIHSTPLKTPPENRPKMSCFHPQERHLLMQLSDAVATCLEAMARTRDSHLAAGRAAQKLMKTDEN